MPISGGERAASRPVRLQDLPSQEEEEEEHKAPAPAPPASGSNSKGKSKSKKKKNPKQQSSGGGAGARQAQQDEDEIDRAIRELHLDRSAGVDTAASSAGTSGDTIAPLGSLASLLAVEPRFLNAGGELRRLFGKGVAAGEGGGRPHRGEQLPGMPRVRGAPRAVKTLKKTVFVTPKPQWPRFDGSIKMERMTEGSQPEFRLTYSKAGWPRMPQLTTGGGMHSAPGSCSRDCRRPPLQRGARQLPSPPPPALTRGIPALSPPF